MTLESFVVVRTEQKVAHRDQAEQLAGLVDDKTVGHECRLDHVAQSLDGIAYADLGRKDCNRRIHHAADAAVRIGLVARPLPRVFGWNAGEYPGRKVFGEMLENRGGLPGIELEQHLSRDIRQFPRQHFGGLAAVAQPDLGDQRPAAQLFVAKCRIGLTAFHPRHPVEIRASTQRGRGVPPYAAAVYRAPVASDMPAVR